MFLIFLFILKNENEAESLLPLLDDENLEINEKKKKKFNI